MRCIEVKRRHGNHGTTRVLVTTADGKSYEFNAGRHVGIQRIYQLAQTIKA